MTGEESGELVGIIAEAIEEKLGNQYPWPGNVRELEQAARRILLTREYSGDRVFPDRSIREKLISGIKSGSLDSQELISSYYSLLYERFGTYEEVSRRMKLDRRTVKRYIDMSRKCDEND